MGEDPDKRPSVLSPSQTWSPHTAALHRRRKIGEKSKNKVLGSLGTLNLDDDGDDDLFVKTLKPKKDVDLTAPESPQRRKNSNKKDASSKKPSSPGATKKAKDKLAAAEAAKRAEAKKKETEEDLKKSIEKFSPEVRAKLFKIINPATPMKERLEIEVEMMKHPEERKILADFRYHAERKTFNIKILETEAQEVEQLATNLEEEAKRAAEEEKEFAKLRQQRVEEEIAKQEREAKLERDVQVHKAKGIVEGAEELRKEAERTAEAALRNKEKKVMAEKEKEQMIQDFINGEGKYMTDVERELRIARMLNEEVGSR